MAKEKTGLAQVIPVAERRRFIRHPLCFPLTYRIVEPGSIKGRASKGILKISKEKKTTTINISMGGLLFAAKKPVKPGAIIIITMPFQGKTFNVRA